MRKGEKMSEEQKQKLSEAAKGRVSWNKGKKFSDEARRNMSKAQTGLKKPNLSKALKGSAKAKKFWFKKGKDNIAYGCNQTGENNHNWKGGMNDCHVRKLVFSNLSNECNSCGESNVAKLHVHHKHLVDTFLRQNSMVYSMSKNLVDMEILCRSCHQKLHNQIKKGKGLVVFSAGQDSLTCLMWAKTIFKDVEAITFSYGQKHSIEIDCAETICKILGVKHTIHSVDTLSWNRNALTDNSIKVKATSTVPTTFVPYRNLHFLLIAATYARSQGIHNLITGVCQTDFSGYKDCRDVFIKSFVNTINEADDYDMRVHTPLMWLTKKETVQIMDKLGHIDLLAYTHTCYEGVHPACGKCPACKLRLKGFNDAGIPDPIQYEGDKK